MLVESRMLVCDLGIFWLKCRISLASKEFFSGLKYSLPLTIRLIEADIRYCNANLSFLVK